MSEEKVEVPTHLLEDLMEYSKGSLFIGGKVHNAIEQARALLPSHASNQELIDEINKWIDLSGAIFIDCDPFMVAWTEIERRLKAQDA